MRDPRSRVAIRRVAPELDAGRFPIKRVVGETVNVEADLVADGHDQLAGVVLHRPADGDTWDEVPLRPLGNDRWHGGFTVDRLGRWTYTVRAWIDRFGTWRHDLDAKADAGVVTPVDLLIGAELVEEAAGRAAGEDTEALKRWAATLADDSVALEERVRAGLDRDLLQLMWDHAERRFATTYPEELEVVVDRERARFSSWYELFPRSTAPEPGRHGTFDDVIARLPYVAELGFDVLYLPPIHPIGTSKRKGPNNAVEAGPDDVGSPWAVGGPEGGHKAVHPRLGTLDDFERLVTSAGEHGLEVALDIAFQCSPDHPWVREHPEWFRHRPDGSIQYAENPPKKYEDILPLDFETDDWERLWAELKSVFDFWIERGVRIFRVDNPHTKALTFWEWCLNALHDEHPDTIFLSEAFTRPKVMYELGKLGFTQGYTYFTWRNTPAELREYYTELTRTEAAEFFRPNAWPNTPDILPDNLKWAGRPAFVARLVLAATLSASYGIYGPPFELMEHAPLVEGKTEYRDSEKYQLRHWDLAAPHSLREVVALVNRIRRQHPALQGDRRLCFHDVDTPELLCYSKSSTGHEDVILCIVNLDPHWTQSGWVHLDLEALGVEPDTGFQVHDLLGGGRYLWHGPVNYVELDPHVSPVHVFAVRHHVATERDFDYFM